MPLRVKDFYDDFYVTDVVDLENALRRRYGQDANSFWLSPDEEKYPSLAMMVKGDFANLHYYPRYSHPGFTSVGAIEGLNRDEMSLFYLDSPNQEQPVLNSSVVRFSAALAAASEFLFSRDLPRAIQWFEL